MGNSSSVCSDLWQLSARASLPWQLSLILLLCLLPCCVPPSQFVAPFWLLRIIANTLAAISLCQSTPLTLPLSFGVAVCLTLQPLKLHALALAIIEARHQSLMGQATRPTCNCGNTIANCLANYCPGLENGAACNSKLPKLVYTNKTTESIESRIVSNPQLAIAS